MALVLTVGDIRLTPSTTVLDQLVIQKGERRGPTYKSLGIDGQMRVKDGDLSSLSYHRLSNLGLNRMSD